LPRAEINPADEPAILARCIAVLDANSGVSTVRRLCKACAVAGQTVTLTDLARLLERSAGVSADESGRVVRV